MQPPSDDSTAMLPRSPRQCRTMWLCIIFLVVLQCGTIAFCASERFFVETTDGDISVFAAIAAHGALRAGFSLDYPPYSMRCRDGATAAGVDVEAALDLADTLGVPLHVVPTTWPSLLADAAAGQFDIAGGGISNTLRRLRAGVAFSQPTSHGGKVVVAPCAAADLLMSNASAASLPAGATVAVNPGGTNEAWIRAHWPNATIRLVAQGEQFGDILAGTANLTVTDRVEARLHSLRYPGQLCAGAAVLSGAEEDVKAWMLPPRSARDAAWARYVDRWVGERRDAYAVSEEAWVARLGAMNESAAREHACDGARRGMVIAAAG